MGFLASKSTIKIFISVLLSSFFTLPSGCTAFCFCYEFFRLPHWMLRWQEALCRNQDPPCSLPEGQALEVERPEVDFFLLKYISLLMTGFFTATYVLSGKTFRTWKLFIGKYFGSQSGDMIESKKGFHLEMMD
jgi:hypothetical protein